MSRTHLGWALLAALSLSACHAPPGIENQPLGAVAANPERRSLDLADRDRPVILMTFSGGGTRAALLASSVMRELGRYEYRTPTGTHNLADDIRMISSVSGGSVAAAYVGLYGTDSLATLEESFLAEDNMSALIGKALNPLTAARLTFTGFTRIDAWEELLDQRLFHHRRMAELNQPGRPYVILNATDMSSGEVFDFTPHRFDDICADLDRLPISVGVAASSAFPVALTPVNFKVFSGPGCNVAPRASIARALEYPGQRYINLPRYKDARYANDLRHGQNSFRKIDYLHLLDGGVADNLGATSLLRVMTEPGSPMPVLAAINTGRVRRLVVIVVNARSDHPNAINATLDGASSLQAQLASVTSIPIDAASAGMARQSDGLINDLTDAVRQVQALPGKDGALFSDMKVFGAIVDFDQFRPEQVELQACAKVVPTSWTLTRDQFATIRASGPTLLRQHPGFRALIADLGIAPPPEVAAPLGCAPASYASTR